MKKIPHYFIILGTILMFLLQSCNQRTALIDDQKMIVDTTKNIGLVRQIMFADPNPDIRDYATKKYFLLAKEEIDKITDPGIAKRLWFSQFYTLSEYAHQRYEKLMKGKIDSLEDLSILKRIYNEEEDSISNYAHNRYKKLMDQKKLNK